MRPEVACKERNMWECIHKKKGNGERKGERGSEKEKKKEELLYFHSRVDGKRGR